MKEEKASKVKDAILEVDINMSWVCEEDYRLQKIVDDIKEQMKDALLQIAVCQTTDNSEWNAKGLKDLRRDIENFIEEY